MTIIPFKGIFPKITENSFIAPDTWITGDVVIEEHCSIFFGAVLRGDINPIRVGQRTNIQEHVLLHTSHGLGPCIIGSGVTIGHKAIIHGATINDNCIIGMGSTILDGAVIGKNSIVGANSLITMNKTFADNSMIMGSPAKVIRSLTEKEIITIEESSLAYVATGAEYLNWFLSS